LSSAGIKIKNHKICGMILCMEREIEVKAKIDDFHVLIKKLESLGCKISGPISQYDYIYNQNGIDLGKTHETPVLRIREQGDRIIFTYKQNISGELDCLEKELDVSNGKTIREIIGMLGYSKSVEVEKIRRKTKYKELEICLDEVKELGFFIEVEKMTDDMNDNGQKMQEELFDFLESIGVSKKNKMSQGYDSMIYEKNSK
jgi:adenylate cyclase class 2